MSLLAQPDDGRCEMQCRMQVLKDIPVFAELAPEFLRVMAYLAERRIYVGGQLILEVENSADVVVVIIKGYVRLVGRDGTVPDRLVLSSGTCIGCMSLLAKFRWAFSLQAVTEVECLILPRHKLAPQFASRPDALAILAAKICESVVDWSRRQLDQDTQSRPQSVWPAML